MCISLARHHVGETARFCLNPNLTAAIELSVVFQNILMIMKLRIEAVSNSPCACRNRPRKSMSERISSSEADIGGALRTVNTESVARAAPRPTPDGDKDAQSGPGFPAKLTVRNSV